MRRALALILLGPLLSCGVLDGLFQLSGDPCVLGLGEPCEEAADCFGCGQLCGSFEVCDEPDRAFDNCGLATAAGNRISDDFNLYLDPQQSVSFDGGTATVLVDLFDSGLDLDPDDVFIRVTDTFATADLRGPPGDDGEGFRILGSGEDDELGAVVHELEVTLQFDAAGPPDNLNLIVQARTDAGQASNSVCVVTNGDFDL